ncbi:MAG: Glyoxalase-like domain [Firmicutes bacterium]|nr:Glyoxalase-like domain [Bacillota bacterium]
MRYGVRTLRPIADKPWGDRVFTVADPDGYELSFALTRASA